MNFLLKYVGRQLQRNLAYFRIVLISVMLATAIIVNLLTLNKSGHADLAEAVTQTYVGKYQLTDKDFYEIDNPRIHPDKFFIYKEENFKKLGEVTPRVLFPIFLSSSQKSVGTLLVGIDEDLEKKYGRLFQGLHEGEFVNKTHSNSLVLGKRLFKKLGAKLGDELVVLGQAIDGSMANELFTVRGVLDLGGGDLEETIVLSDLQSVRNLASLPPDSAHLLTLYSDEVQAFEEAGKTLLGESGKVHSWRELLPDLALSIDTMGSITWLISIVIIFVIGFGVSSTFFISFVEREKEFKALSTIGIPYPWVQKSLIIEILALMIFALLIGNLSALLLNIFLYYHPIPLSLFTGGKAVLLGGLNLDPHIKMRFYYSYYFLTSFLMILSVLAATLYPVLRLSRRSRHVV